MQPKLRDIFAMMLLVVANMFEFASLKIGSAWTVKIHIKTLRDTIKAYDDTINNLK